MYRQTRAPFVFRKEITMTHAKRKNTSKKTAEEKQHSLVKYSFSLVSSAFGQNWRADVECVHAMGVKILSVSRYVTVFLAI